MIALISAVLGFAMHLFPEFMGFFKSKQNNSHELEILKLQIQARKETHIERMEEINANADIEEMRAVHQPQQVLGIDWVDALNGTVRPVLAYAFFILYAYVKYKQSAAGELLWKLWTEEDAAIFGAIIGFYFGGRALRKK